MLLVLVNQSIIFQSFHHHLKHVVCASNNHLHFPFSIDPIQLNKMICSSMIAVWQLRRKRLTVKLCYSKLCALMHKGIFCGSSKHKIHFQISNFVSNRSNYISTFSNIKFQWSELATQNEIIPYRYNIKFVIEIRKP